jgi:dienelactone hydrolase
MTKLALADSAPMLPATLIGPHAVGMRLVQQYDYSRFSRPAFDIVTGQATSGTRVRPVQTLVWYPAKASAKASAKPMRYVDYARTSITQQQFSFSPEQYQKLLAATLAQETRGMSEADAHSELQRPMLAGRDRTPLAGKFPLVIYAPGAGGEAHDNVELCEFLASHGYWVLASASSGAYSRGITLDLEGAEAQMRDIQFLMAYAHGLPQVDIEHIAVLGPSLGGSAGLMAAAKDERVKALLALDGAFRYHPELTEGAAYMKPERIKIPVLFFSAADRTQDKAELEKLTQQGDNSWLKKLKYGDFYRLSMEPMEHGAFGGLNVRIYPAASFEVFTKPQVIEAYGWMARYSLQFLNAYLKNDVAGMAFLKNEPQKNGAPAGWLQMETRPGIGAAPTVESLAVEVARRGFVQLPQVLAAVRAKHPGFKPEDMELYLWGRALQDADKLAQAIEVFKLNASENPERPWAHIILARALVQAKKPQLALQSFQKALQLEPGNGAAAAGLKALQEELEKAK